MYSFTAFAAEYLAFVIAIVALAFWLLLPRAQKLPFALQMIAGLAAAFILAKLASAMWYDPRPFVVDGISPLIPHAADNGFPSEHTTYSMLIACIVLLFSRHWGVLLLALAALVAWGRVEAHIHSPLQVLAGATVGAVAAALAYLAGRFIRPYRRVERLSSLDKRP